MNCIGMQIADGEVGKFSMSQVWNPVGSGRNIEISKLSLTTTSWGATPAGTRAADLVHSTAPLGTMNQNISRNKNLASSESPVAEMRSLRVVPSSQTGIPPFHELWCGQPEDDKTYTFDPPIVLPPGNGIHVRGAQTAMYIVTSWQWCEVAIVLD